MLNGSPIMEGYVPREDATVVTRLLDAGAHIVGKTAVPAFCFDGGGLTGYPEPQPMNPHDPDLHGRLVVQRQRGVLVNGEADLALGGDQGGSIRLPASWSGCCGHKPTFGLVPYTGIFPIELTIDHIGPMARTVADCALMLDAIAGEDGLDPRQIGVSVQDYAAALEVGADGLRVGVLREGFGIPDASEPDVDAAVRAAADVLARAGAERRGGLGPDAPRRARDLERDRDRGRDRPDGPRRRASAPTTRATTRPTWSTSTAARGAPAAMDYSVTVKLTVLLGAYLSERYNHHYYAKAQNLGRRLNARYAEALERFDVLVLPTTRDEGAPVPGRRRRSPRCSPPRSATSTTRRRSTSPATRRCACRAGCRDGLPIGMMLVGRHFDDATVLRAGHAYQASAGPLEQVREEVSLLDRVV